VWKVNHMPNLLYFTLYVRPIIVANTMGARQLVTRQ